MDNIISQIPGIDNIKEFISDKIKLDQLNLDVLKNLNIDEISSKLDLLKPELPEGFCLPEIPQSLTPDGLLSNLNSSISSIKSVNPIELLGDLVGGNLLPDLQNPDFNINGIINQINSQILPLTSSIPSINTDINGINLGGIFGPLNDIAKSGVTAPLKVLNMFLAIINSISSTLSDSDKLISIGKESISDIFISEVDELKSRVPLIILDNSIEVFTEGSESFLNKYNDLLDSIDNGDKQSSEDIKEFYEKASEIIPTINNIEKYNQTLVDIKENNSDRLSESINNVVNFGSSDRVFLEDLYNNIGNTISGVLDGVKGPFEQLTAVSDDVVTFMNNVADKADGISDTIYTNINYTVKDFLGPIYEVTYHLNKIEQDINDFFSQVKVEDIIKNYKKVYRDISIKVEEFVIGLETLKIKLDSGVIKLKLNVDNEFSAVFDEIEEKIRETLEKISGVLEKEEVKQALEKAKSVMDKCKKVIDDVSLNPVVDFVVNKTNEAEEKVESIDTSILGTPEKTIIKMGTKIVEQAEVDKIVKDQLMEIYTEINEPLKELVKIIEDNVMAIQKKIFDFNPGTIATDFILNSEPYKLIISTLELLKPSNLLKPIKDAHTLIVNTITEMDPDIIVDALQAGYETIMKILPVINPDSLRPIISDGANVLLYKFNQINDTIVNDIVDKIKSSLSLEKLMESTGIQEIANADFWNIIKDLLSGSFLDHITTALGTVETKLAEVNNTIDFSKPMESLQEAITGIEQQLNVNADIIKNRISDVKDLIDNSTSLLNTVKEKRDRLISENSDSPEVKWILEKIDIEPLYEFKANINMVFALENSVIERSHSAISDVLLNYKRGIEAISQVSLQNALPDIFKRQLSDPTNDLINLIKEKLDPFEDAVTAIQNILNTLITIPGRIDAAFGSILDSIQLTISTVVKFMIGNIELFLNEIVDILQAVYDNIYRIISGLNPYWLFNCFSIYDFYGIDYRVDQEGEVNSQVKNINKSIHFKFGSHKIHPDNNEKYASVLTDEYSDEEFQAELDDLSNAINDNIISQNRKIKSIKVFGFCDPVGKSSFHKTLSANRIFAVKEHLYKMEIGNSSTTIIDGVEKPAIAAYFDDSETGIFNPPFKEPLKFKDIASGIEHLVDMEKYGEMDITGYNIGEDVWLDDSRESYKKDGTPPTYIKEDRHKRVARIVIEYVEIEDNRKYIINDATGILAVAKSICQPNGNSIALLLQSKLTEDELNNLKDEIIDNVNPDSNFLSDGNCRNVIKALNMSLLDNSMATETIYTYVKNNLTTFVNQLKTFLSESENNVNELTDEEISQRVEKIVWKYRGNALSRALDKSRLKYNGAAIKTNFLIRLNRVILESHYIYHVRLSLQSFFLFLLEVISNIYPEVAISNMDEIYEGILKNIKEFPERMIKEPLNSEFDKIRTTLKESFDVEDLFKILNLKLEGMDTEVEEGLNRISISYNEMLNSIDNSLSK